ncbi:MAG: glycosyl transferase [Bacteroidetes bacterium GWD2_45_23]|nr:MAG: glycosyl transferase [Bacteroidetes bacterium GWC2_46_850]OFX80171.1 MAG: glycosyl transferase [Bacteroidetes bacterium GWC1_47_7]OFX86827.1 MAG: glycosyl transferase [Bacteroidetes bacterium GWD2_45_23]HBA99781.1 glycosyltransferase family 1 protein [Porphyromonadaceae bacterium]HCC18640.1 glycosyltransferase family 1 protein [Porphyromonadaceae bacterium]
MKIVIEAQRIFRKHKHGMDFVALETIRALQQLDHTNDYFILVRPDVDRCLQETANFQIVEIQCPTYFLWEQVALPLALAKIKPDIVHCTSNTAPICCPYPLILTLHDIIFLEKKKRGNQSVYQQLGRVYRRWIVPRVVPKCQLIITVSDYERNHIQKTLSLGPVSIVTVYNGLSPVFNPSRKDRTIVQKYIPEAEYLFFLGNTDPKKNTAGTLKAYSLYLQKSQRKLPLLIADLKESVIDALLSKGDIEEIKSYLYYPGYISNKELPYVYAGAFAFLYTSLRESFGLPLLEAMASGVPVITSQTSALPEIAGEGALLADPSDPGTIAQLLIELEENSVLYSEATRYGLHRASLFPWEQTARKTLEFYNRLTPD